MADTVDTQVVFAGTRYRTYRFTNVSDATGETDVVKIDISTLTGPSGGVPTKMQIIECAWTMQGFSSIRLEWDANTDDEAMILVGNGYKDFWGSGGLTDPRSAGATGDLLLTTIGAVANASYDILITVRLKD